MAVQLNENNLSDLYDLMHRFGESRAQLNDWERGFMDDFRARYEEYGERIKVSTKQWDILVRVGKKLKVPGMM